MQSGTGSRELSRIATAHLVAVAFGMTFVVASALGVDGMTALTRALIVAGISLLPAFLLCSLVVDTVLAAMARDEAQKRNQTPGEPES